MTNAVQWQPLAGFDVYFKLLATAVCVVFALVVLSASRRRVHWILSAFFLFIAANQASESARALAAGGLSAEGWRRMAAVFAACDPFILYWFASLYPEPNGLGSRRNIWVTAVAAAALALWAGWFSADLHPARLLAPAQFIFPVLLGAFTAALYGAVLVRALRLHDGGQSTPFLLFAAATAVAFFRPAGFFAESAVALTFHLQGIYLIYSPWVEIAFIANVAMLLTCYVFLARRFPRGRIALLIGLGTAGALISVQFFDWVTAYFDQREAFARIEPIGHASTAIRFLVIGTLMSTAIIRHDALGASLRGRRLAARAFILLTVATVLALAAAPFVGRGAVPSWGIAAFAAAILLSQGFHKAVDAVAWQLFAVPPPSDPVRQLGAYRAALRQAIAEGRALDDPAIMRLRSELGIEPDVAAVLADAAESDRGPIREGAILLSRYRVARPLGSGTGGRVFLARDERIGRDVVLKEVMNGQGQAVDVAIREARAAGETPNPHIVALFDVFPRSRTMVLVSEYVAGGTLGERVAAKGRLKGDEAIRLIDGILRGVAAIHARGVIHRDLKPANILLTIDGTPKIADFGLARLGADDITHVGTGWTTAGTPAYMAPEQRRGAPATARSDIYAIGLVLRQSLDGPLPEAVAVVIERAHREDPADRYANAAEMLDAFEAAQRAQ